MVGPVSLKMKPVIVTLSTTYEGESKAAPKTKEADSEFFLKLKTKMKKFVKRSADRAYFKAEDDRDNRIAVINRFLLRQQCAGRSLEGQIKSIKAENHGFLHDSTEHGLELSSLQLEQETLLTQIEQLEDDLELLQLDFARQALGLEGNELAAVKEEIQKQEMLLKEAIAVKKQGIEDIQTLRGTTHRIIFQYSSRIHANNVRITEMEVKLRMLKPFMLTPLIL